MKISQYLSWKISILSFIAIVMVIYIHSYYIEAESFPLSTLTQKIGSCITFPSVPLFYAISGFLFFNGVNHWKNCLPKMKKRIKTLVVPYLIGNIVFVLWYVGLAIIPGCSKYVNSDMLGCLSITKPLSTLSYLFVKPAAFQLWFLRDLIVFMAFSPLIYLLIKHTKCFAFVLTFLVTGWATRLWLTYFVFGGLLAQYYPNKIELFRSRYKYIPIISFVVYVLWCVASIGNLLVFDNVILARYVSQLIVLLPLISIWGGYDLLVRTSYVPSKFVLGIVGYTFFIFLFHEPSFNIIKKLGLVFLGVGEWQLIILYLINPIIMVFVSIVVAKVLERTIPYFYSITVGGRINKRT